MHNSGNAPNNVGFETASLLAGGSAPSSSSAPSSAAAVGAGAASSAYGMTPEQASREFDLLRREATKLERLLEDKVARYQQLAQRLSISGDSYSQSSTSSQQQRSSLLEHVESGTASSFNHPNTNLTNNNSINNSEEEHLSKEISRLLSSFTELLNTRMSPASERTGRSQHALLVKRYREILFDCGSDYYKTMEVVRRKKEARELMRGAVTNGAAGAGGGGGEGDGMEHLLRERSSIDASLNSTNAILSQASSVRNELRTQGQNLRGISGTMSVIAGHVPGLNGLIDKIKKKRMQDDRVVSGVVAGCILFTLWYLFG